LESTLANKPDKKTNRSCFQSTSHRIQLLCTWVCHFRCTKTGQRFGL